MAEKQGPRPISEDPSAPARIAREVILKDLGYPKPEKPKPAKPILK